MKNGPASCSPAGPDRSPVGYFNGWRVRGGAGMARTGRRPGVSGTREAILDAARRAFAEQGYQRATIRGVAELAGVDPALVHHYFGTKQELFVAAVRLPVNPVEQLTTVLAAEPDQVGPRI